MNIKYQCLLAFDKITKKIRKRLWIVGLLVLCLPVLILKTLPDPYQGTAQVEKIENIQKIVASNEYEFIVFKLDGVQVESEVLDCSKPVFTRSEHRKPKIFIDDHCWAEVKTYEDGFQEVGLYVTDMSQIQFLDTGVDDVKGALMFFAGVLAVFFLVTAGRIL